MLDNDDYPDANHRAGMNLPAKLGDFVKGPMLGFMFQHHGAYGLSSCGDYHKHGFTVSSWHGLNFRIHMMI